ncbi:MmcQ/YjbR family DNA-binding protein [Gallaecimonas mangrovi]|uniref:MmcQ/YjbR family DNA-binding protein n=1 Tax=Gallaecimonas mangrovi TaxID=2291597 RepID=UPI000E1FE12D|nr:MmcQ/YjbR family DNA-binding protein [Gallaecimonas mangrovi]
MDAKALRQYLLTQPEAIESFPFGPDAAVYKVRGKMFALTGHFYGADAVNLKCDPHEAMALRDIFSSVKAAYHMNKLHWNTVLLDSSIPEGEIRRMVDNSFALVVRGLRKKERDAFKAKYAIGE